MSNIRVVDIQNKFEIVRNLAHNCIYNRFDLVWMNEFDLIEVSDGNERYYLPYHIEKFKRMYLSPFMLKMPDDVFCDVIDFIKDRFKSVISIDIWHALNSYEGLRKTNNNILYLPKTIEEYNTQFTSKTLYNRRYARKKLEKSFNIEFKHFQRNEFTPELLEAFLRFKNNENVSVGENVYYLNDYKSLLGSVYYLTDMWALYINGEIAAVILYSTTDGKDYWCENMAYNVEYRQYGIGNILYYYSIEEIIKRSGKMIVLGGGNYDYKINSKAVSMETYTGVIYLKRNKMINLFRVFGTKLFSIRSEIDRYYNKRKRVITVLGLRFKKEEEIKI